MHAIIILPVLNEQDSLISTCHSLGFGFGENVTPQDVKLFIVDNGSTDNSIQIAESIKKDSLDSSVLIALENERGYVPPRRRGATLAREFAISYGWDERNVLIIQADADTIYKENYIELMRDAADKLDNNILLQGEAQYPPQFAATYTEYTQMCEEIDSELEEFFTAESNDILVDDKLAGYRLHDYFIWGEHQREYTPEGDEIHSETARLYMKARTFGATKFVVEGAQAFPSMRKTIEEPSLHFAAAGFPRERTWNEKWRKDYHGPTTIKDFCLDQLHPEVQKAIKVRRQHLISLLGIIPIYISKALGESIDPKDNSLYSDILSILPNRTIEFLRYSPGTLITDVFNLIDSQGAEIMNSLYSNFKGLG